MNVQSKRMIAFLVVLFMFFNIGLGVYADAMKTEENEIDSIANTSQESLDQEVKPEAEPEVKPEAEPEVKPEAKPEAEPEANRPSMGVFSIIGPDKPTASYTFMADGAQVDKQFILDNGKLEEPAAPANQTGRKFVGWYIEGETTAIDFTANIAVTSDVEYTVNAKFEDVFYVYFVYNENIIRTKEVVPGGTTDANDVPLVVLEDGKALDHWSTSENGTEFYFTSLITADTTLYAVLADRWKVEFDTQGGSSLLPKYIPNGDHLGAVSVPVRPGYKFKRWNTKADGTGINYTNTSVINSSIKLYAIWEAKTANYSIVYWQENADDTDYTYKETVTASGATGSTITLTGTNISNLNFAVVKQPMNLENSTLFDK